MEQHGHMQMRPRISFVELERAAIAATKQRLLSQCRQSNVTCAPLCKESVILLPRKALMFANDDVANVRLSSGVNNGSEYCYGQPMWGLVWNTRVDMPACLKCRSEPLAKYPLVRCCCTTLSVTRGLECLMGGQ